MVARDEAVREDVPRVTDGTLTVEGFRTPYRPLILVATEPTRAVVLTARSQVAAHRPISSWRRRGPVELPTVSPVVGVKRPEGDDVAGQPREWQRAQQLHRVLQIGVATGAACERNTERRVDRTKRPARAAVPHDLGAFRRDKVGLRRAIVHDYQLGLRVEPSHGLGRTQKQLCVFSRAHVRAYCYDERWWWLGRPK